MTVEKQVEEARLKMYRDITVMLEQSDLSIEEQETLLRYVRNHKPCYGTGRAGYFDGFPLRIKPCDCIKRGLRRIERARAVDKREKVA